jgi:two-component system cell cycle sensor histidine kinase/response regulator CckA
MMNQDENAAGGALDPNREQEILKEIAVAVGGSLNLRQVLRAAGRKILELVGYDGLAFYLTDRRRREMRLVLSMGLGADLLRRAGKSVPYGRGFAGRVGVTGEPIFAEDFTEIAGMTVHTSLLRMGVKTFVAIPLRAGHHVVGALDLSSLQTRESTPSEMRVLESAGGLLGAAVEKAQLYERARARARLERLVNAIASELRRSLSSRAISDAAVRELCRALRATQCMLAEIEEEVAIIAHEFRRGDVPSAQGRFLLADYPASLKRRLTAGRTLVVDDVSSDRDLAAIYAGMLAPRGIRSMLVVPLILGGHLRAALIVTQCDRKRRWTEEDIALAQSVAGHTALAVENARLFERTSRSEQEYIALYEQAPDMYHMVDTDGRIVKCNATESKALGYHKLDLIGMRWSDLCAGAGREELEERLKQFAAGSVRSFTLEVEMRHQNGALLNVSVRAVPVYEGGKYTGARVVMRDITAQKQLERQLVQAQKMESLGTLAGGIAHDFNNLLTGVIGYAALLKRRLEPDSPLYRYADTIEKSGQRAAELTRQLLTFARTAALQFRLINLNEVARETAALLSRSLEKQILLEMNLASDLRYVQADPVQMEQVLLNLCVNARDAMPEGGKLTISTRNRTPDTDKPDPRFENLPADCVILSIADTGHGMDAETCARIFDPFFTTKEPGKGTGLGLAMVYSIISQHNGRIIVESDVGTGTTFHLYLPASDQSATVKPEEAGDRFLRISGRVLVVDDEAGICDLMRDTLTGFGLIVYTVESGQEAVSFYRERASDIDLVIVDLMMPDMDGRETFWQLRANDPGAPILLMSGYSDDATVHALLRAGARGFLRKPWNRQELFAVVRQAMEG